MNYVVYLNNGQSITITGATFDVVEFTKTLNNREITFISIGNAVINKNLIGSITPVPADNQ